MTDRPEDWDSVEEAVELLATGELDAAVAELEAVLGREPENPYAYYFLGQTHFEREAYDKALKAYVEALSRMPEHRGALIGAGHSLRLLGRLDEALRVGRQALALAAEDPDALYLLGVTHFARGDDHVAAELLTRFLATKPEAEAGIEVAAMLQTIRGEIVPAEDD